MTDEELERVMAQFEARGGYNPDAPVYDALSECALCCRTFKGTVVRGLRGGVLVNGLRFLAAHCRLCSEEFRLAPAVQRAEICRIVEDNLLKRLAILTELSRG